MVEPTANWPGRELPSPMAATWETATSDPDPLVALGAAKALAVQLSGWEAKLASEALAEGATWEAIGSAVGVSRQAAWERFHRDVGRLRLRASPSARAAKSR